MIVGVDCLDTHCVADMLCLTQWSGCGRVWNEFELHGLGENAVLRGVIGHDGIHPRPIYAGEAMVDLSRVYSIPYFTLEGDQSRSLIVSSHPVALDT